MPKPEHSEEHKSGAKLFSLGDEFAGSLTQGIRERLRSPILGNFTIFFLAYHWKCIVMLLTSPSRGQQLIQEVESVMPGIRDGVIAPVVMATAFVLVYPFLRVAYRLLIQFIYIHERNRIQQINMRELDWAAQRSAKELETATRDNKHMQAWLQTKVMIGDMTQSDWDKIKHAVDESLKVPTTIANQPSA